MSCKRFASSIGLRALAAVALVLLFAGASFGSTIDHGTGLAGLFQTITFSELSFAQNTPITTQFSSLGVSFSPQLYYDTPDTLYANIVGDRLQNYYPCCNTFSIFFTNVQSAVDFNFVTQPGTTTFTAKLGGVIQETFTTSTDLLTSPNFYGFQGISLDEIDVSVASVNGAMQLDNIQMAVPEPGGWTLLASGLMALAAFSRRMKAR
jgi:hypothetical protein